MTETDPKDEPQIVELDDGKYVVMKDDDGKDVAIPVNDNFALAEIKKAEASIVSEREQTNRAVEKHKTGRLHEITGTIIFLALIATCALT